MRTVIVTLVVGWAAFQVLLPIATGSIRATTSWHEQGHYFAWQMMLRQKDGRAMFYVRDPDTNREWLVDPRRFLSSRQERYMAHSTRNDQTICPLSRKGVGRALRDA